MPLETASYIGDLVITNPAAGDVKGEGDDHIRLIKKALANSFPNLSGALNRLVLKSSNYTVVATDSFAMLSCGSSMVLALTAAATLGAGFMVGIHADGASFTIDPASSELINGATTLVVEANSWGYLYCDGTAFTLLQSIPLALSRVYPIGSVYINASNSANPNTIFGFGTWDAIGAGKVLVGVDATDPLFDTIAETGGSKDAVAVSHTHTATVSDPGHRHNVTTYAGVSPGSLRINSGTVIGEGGSLTSINATGISVAVSTAGVSGANQNLQPYITVYMWKRTA